MFENFAMKTDDHNHPRSLQYGNYKKKTGGVLSLENTLAFCQRAKVDALSDSWSGSPDVRIITNKIELPNHQA